MFPQRKIQNTLVLLLLFFTVNSYRFTLSADDNYCLGGKDIRNINSKQKAFNSGPCAPIIMVPGFLGTGLQVQIDCPVLQENNPEIFKQCGWSTCNASDLTSFVKMPRKEYRIWIGDLFDKFSVIQTQDQKCLAEFLKFQSGSQKNYTDPKGLKITWVGNTPQTMTDSNCGTSSVQNLIGSKISLVHNCGLNGYERLIGTLQNMGYLSGINFQVIPYDFRKTVHFSEAQQYIKNSIANLFKNTGKKVVLFGHSYGNLQILKILQDLDPEQKKQKVNHFVSVGAPFLGSLKAIKEIVGGDASYTKNFLTMQLGFNYHSQQALALNSRSLVHFLPRSNLVEFKQKKWFQDVLANPPTWLPENDGNFPLRNLINIFNEPVLKINNGSFSSSKASYQTLFGMLNETKSHHFLNLIQEGFNDSDSLFNLEKPDVNTTLIFSGSEPTDIQYTYDSISSTSQFKVPSSTVTGGGDGTVSSISNILAGIKWINQNNEGGVKIINYGGSNKQSNQYYDTMPTECSSKGSSNCLHACFHQDNNILGYLRNILINGQKINEGRLVHPNCENLKINNV